MKLLGRLDVRQKVKYRMRKGGSWSTRKQDGRAIYIDSRHPLSKGSLTEDRVNPLCVNTDVLMHARLACHG
jgi:hypothetical protein